MLFKFRPISNPKKKILQSVFNDNLRIAGKFTEAACPSKWTKVHRYVWGLGLLVLVAVIGPFPERSMETELAQTVTVSASENTGSAVLPTMYATAAHMEPYESYQPKSEVPIPLVDFYINGDHHSHDYSLLISPKAHVRLSSLFGLDVKTIVIDPGHGGKDPGAIGIRGTKEKDITLDVSRRLKQRLPAKGPYNILLTRETDQTVPLAQRVAFAKSSNADLFISVHVNSLPNQTVNVIETFYFGPPLTSEILHLAEQENKESQYTIGELNGIIQDIGNTLKRQESAMLAASIQESLFMNVRNHDDQVLDVGIKTAPFVVLSRIDVPSVLVEISCLTKEEEEVKLASAEYREKIASFIEEGIIRYLEKQHTQKTIIGGLQ